MRGYDFETPQSKIETPPAFSRRSFLRLASLTTVAVVATACTSAGMTTVPPSDEQVQLVYQDWRTDWFPPMAQEMLEMFHEMHPNIRVFYTPDPDNVEDQMLADMNAGTAPDVFQGCCTFFPIWAQEGHTLNLRPLVEADLDQDIIDDWAPAQYRSFFLNDEDQYGLPKYHGALALYYNKDLFEAYEVDYPTDAWNHDDYAEAMQRLTHDQNGDGQTDLWGSMLDISWDRIQMHVNGWGGHLVDPADSTRCLIAEPEAMAAMRWIRNRMWDEKVMATPLDVRNIQTRDAFIIGQVAMVEDGSWALRDILEKADFRIGIVPFPAGPERRVTLATTDGFGIYAGSKHPEAAWALMKFLISEDYGRAMAKANFLQPARASLVDDWVSFIREAFPDKAKDVDIAAFADGHLNGYSVTAEIFANMAEARAHAYAAWDEIFILGQRELADLAKVCKQIEATQ